MPLLLKLRGSAVRDLANIVNYIAAQNGDYVIANRFKRRILDRCRELLIAPGAGSIFPVENNVRKINVGAHKIIYRVEENRIIILRIWGGRRGSDPGI